jgi:hypothetical protein
MEFSRPATWADALAIRAEQPAALAVAGGTDVMVDINFDRARPAALLDLTGIDELAEWSADGPVIRLGAGVPYTRVIDELGGRLPGLAMASTVGSPRSATAARSAAARLNLPGRRRPPAAAGLRHRGRGGVGAGTRTSRSGSSSMGETLGASPGRADRRGPRPVGTF